MYLKYRNMYKHSFIHVIILFFCVKAEWTFIDILFLCEVAVAQQQRTQVSNIVKPRFYIIE